MGGREGVGGAVALKIGGLGLERFKAFNGGGVELGSLGNL
jgi:hypothetical protein